MFQHISIRTPAVDPDDTVFFVVVWMWMVKLAACVLTMQKWTQLRLVIARMRFITRCPGMILTFFVKEARLWRTVHVGNCVQHLWPQTCRGMSGFLMMSNSAILQLHPWPFSKHDKDPLLWGPCNGRNWSKLACSRWAMRAKQ